MGTRVGKGVVCCSWDGWLGGWLRWFAKKDGTWFWGQGGVVVWSVIVVSGLVFHGRRIFNESRYLGGGHNILGFMEDSMGVVSDLGSLSFFCVWIGYNDPG